MHKYIIMGAQGSGKGTQANLLKEEYNLVHISVGDIFRWNIQSHTKLGARIKRITEAGELVSDEIVEEIVQRRLQEHDWNYGFILDGFPRNKPQARFFLESYDIDAVIHIEVPDEAVIQRMLARRKCSSCGLDYNLIGHRPKELGVCDVCGGTLEQRADDNESAILNRLRDYHEKTFPILELFRRKELVIQVDGTGDPQEIQEEIRDRLGMKQKVLTT
ncbi:MAG: adenylate kinase [Candidatus Omnitrophica bacterium]|nr:adenylate kinase [Candidatus Omnitrophota bacterium]MCB9784685.1 adenylate kinase [Candidatus Omnitrophota bacterium]